MNVTTNLHQQLVTLQNIAELEIQEANSKVKVGFMWISRLDLDNESNLHLQKHLTIVPDHTHLWKMS